MNSEKRLRGTPRCGEAADVEVVLNFHIPVRVSPRLPGTPPVICSSPDRRTPRWASGGALCHALSDANDDDTITPAVAVMNR
jgi:hypothetical protein